jgi:hypothetical protein
MQVLHIIDTLRSGGKERQLVEVLKSLSDEKNMTSELVIMSDNIHYDYINELNIKTYQIIRKYKKDLSIFSKFYQIIKKTLHENGKKQSFYTAKRFQ